LSQSLRVEGVSKRYGAVQALDNISLEFVPGEVHAVLGENGAGKSTLMNVLAGFSKPDYGSVSLGEEPLPSGSPILSQRAGIEMVHQHFTLVPEFTVRENLALNALLGLGGRLDLEGLSEPALEQGRALGWNIDAQSKVADLPVGTQQRVEILKVLARGSKVVIFDEPTAVLSPPEVDELFNVMRRLKDSGRILILIAHKLAEVLSVADRVTVLRRGKWIATADRSEVDERQLATWMVGDLPAIREHSGTAELVPGLVASNLRVLGDRGEVAVDEVELEVRRGEIVGIGGVDGNGQVELAEALAEIRPLSSGTISHKFSRIAYIPQDRQADGLALTMSIADNLVAAGIPDQLKLGPWINPMAVRTWAADLIQKFEIKAERPETKAETLSGGNQQKIVVARNLSETPDFMVVSNPTRGLDIRATDYVHSQIEAARAKGAAVILFSTDLDELAALASRTLFMSRGRLRETFADALGAN